MQGKERTKNTQSPGKKDGDHLDEEGCTDLRSMVFITFCMAWHCIALHETDVLTVRQSSGAMARRYSSPRLCPHTRA